MFQSYFDLNPEVATYFGLHEPYDYQLSDGSTSHIQENLEFMEEWARRMEEELDPDQLNSEHRIDLKVLKMALELNQFSFYEHRIHETNPDVFRELGDLFFVMFTREYAPLEKRVDAIAARLEQVPQYLGEFQSRFKESEPVKLWTEIALERSQLFPEMFQQILEASGDNISKDVRQRLERALEDLEGPLGEHMDWLEDLLSEAEREWALGREKFEKLIQIRGLGLSSDEIYEFGVRSLKELKERRSELAQRIAPGKSVDEIMEVIEEDAPENFEDALRATKEEMLRAKRFIKERELATVYEQDVLAVEETPSFMRVLTPFAALFMPGKFDEPRRGVYIVTRPKENLGKHLNHASIRNTAVHEAFPGHFLQGSVSSRGPLIRLLIDATETVEGWAHYCEQMMREQGFFEDLKTKFVQVNDGIWRAVRVIVDVRLSRGEMKFDDAVKMLIDEVGMSKDAAISEVRRYTMTPGYVLSYLLGKHLILQLRKEIKEKMGSKFDLRFFHDTIISNGHLPITLLRDIFAEKLKG